MLTQYGIQTEESDFRIHVCFGEGYVYAYRTADGLQAIASGRFPQRNASQPGTTAITGQGYIVPPGAIRSCRRYAIPTNVGVICLPGDDPSAKGDKAVAVVLAMLRNSAQIITDRELQIKGWDLVVRGVRIQVKCDYHGGLNGTGNLFLQTAERNIFVRT